MDTVNMFHVLKLLFRNYTFRANRLVEMVRSIFARSSTNSLRNASEVSRNATSDSLALIRSVTVRRPFLLDPLPKRVPEGGGGIGSVSANRVISGRLRARNRSIRLVEVGFADAVLRTIRSPKSCPRFVRNVLLDRIRHITGTNSRRTSRMLSRRSWVNSRHFG